MLLDRLPLPPRLKKQTITIMTSDRKTRKTKPDTHSGTFASPAHRLTLRLQKSLHFPTAPAPLITLYLLISLFLAIKTEAQTPMLQPSPFNNPIPSTNQPFNQNNNYQPYQQPTNTPMGMNANDVIEMTYRMTEQQSGTYVDRPHLTPQQNQIARQRYIMNKMTMEDNESKNRQKQVDELMREINADLGLNSNYTSDTKSFESAFNNLDNMLTGKTKLSVSKAYFEIEAAYGSTYLDEKEYNDILNRSADFIKQWLAQNKYNPAKNEDLQYGIQKFMKDTLSITIKLPENKTKTITHTPFNYDYQDFQAEKDHRNFFVTKCIATGTGQCNSLPGTYLSIAEKLGAKTYLSLAPQHSFIKYPDSKGSIHAYEPTSNWKISDKWYVENLGISPQAINSGIYLDTLNKKMIVADCMLNLAFGFLKKHGASDGEFVSKCVNTAMKYFPRGNNITAYFIKGSLLTRMLGKMLRDKGYNSLNDIDKVAGARQLYNEIQKNDAIIKQLGYQPMPEEMYLQMMQYHEFRGVAQQQKKTDTKQKRSLFTTSIR